MRLPATLFVLVLMAEAIGFAQTGSGNSAPAQQQSSPPVMAAPSGSPQAQPSPISSPANVQASPIQAPQSASDQVAAGTEIHATLDTPLSTKISKPGDRFTATIADPVHGSAGLVVIPAGARVEGEIADADQSKLATALKGKEKLDLHFRDLVLPNGQTLPLTATLISVNSTNGRSIRKIDDEHQVQSGTEGRDVAKNSGIAASENPSGGLIFGAPLKGLAIGALDGGGYVLATKTNAVNLPAQTGMVIRLDQPVSSASPSAPSQ